MNRMSKVWGIVLVIVGLIIGANSLGIINFDIFFDGWWTLFIIVPCTFGLFNKQTSIISLAGILLGFAFLLEEQRIIENSWGLIFPIIIVTIGAGLLFKNNSRVITVEKSKELSKNTGENYTSIFSAIEKKISKVDFKGAELVSIFGGIDLDIREAKIKEDIKIEIVSIFGGVDLMVPKDVNVVINNSPAIFGGYESKIENEYDEKKPTIYVNQVCIFGGVDIKN